MNRGKDYHSQEVEDNKQVIYDNIKKIVPRFKVVSFDNLALEQLNIKRIMSNEQWQEFFMGEDGNFTLFVDIPKNYFARSSMCNVRYDLLDNIDDMFEIIKQNI